MHLQRRQGEGQKHKSFLAQQTHRRVRTDLLRRQLQIRRYEVRNLYFLNVNGQFPVPIWRVR